MEPNMKPVTRPSTVVKCETHGFFYDSAKVSGCAVCRRESGELPPPRPAGAARPAPARGGWLGPALAVTVLLIGVTTFAMSMVHSTFIGWLRDTGNPSGYDQINTYERQQMEGALKELKGEGEDEGDGSEEYPEPD
jgi:hypothetical protein